ncbi:MAG: hypothetical protein NTX25_12805 [Proteobacteria bacterium]|nr:hypothetical protein [Pseudomonadota bacterium]
MIILVVSNTACQSGVFPISQREYLYEKEGKSPHLGHRRPVEERSKSSTEIYVKRESLAIVPQETKNYTGSLFSLKRAENSLFIDLPRGGLGESIDVLVKVNRSEAPAPPSPGAPAPGSAAPAAPAGGKDAGKGLQDELIAALPKLEPGQAAPKVPSSIKMRVMRKLENGDVLVEASRASKNEWDTNSIRALSRIPRSKLAGNQPITTLDLAEVQWSEIQGAQTIERESSDWQDEYTMRWAGFEEARSKAALELEAKRKDMQLVKDRLQDRIVNLGKERGQIAVERERVKKLREEAEVKLSEYNKKMEEQTSLIEQQKDTIKKQEALLEAPQTTDANGNPISNPGSRKEGPKGPSASEQAGGKK